ncbi:MAG: helicase-associated domain-containing protein [Deltaproteobacteria bacterium]|jgi:hypothetical protein|nr:helicase-associated domain-containing protein [Deltaproteobacteria bacterium]
MLEDELEAILSRAYQGDKDIPGSLAHIAHLVGVDFVPGSSDSDMQDLVCLLMRHYAAPGRCRQLWDSLSDVEREVVSLHIWSKGLAPLEHVHEIAQKHGLSQRTGSSQMSSYFYYYFGSTVIWSFLRYYGSYDSPLWALAPTGRCLFQSELTGVIGEMERRYSDVAVETPLFEREARTNDFVSLVRFCNSFKVTTTKSGFLSKGWISKLIQYGGYDEYPSWTTLSPEQASRPEDYLTTYHLVILGQLAGLVSIAEGVCSPSPKAAALISQPREVLAKHIFESYLQATSYDELSILDGLRAQRGHQPSLARRNLAEELKLCPPGRLIQALEFEKHLRLARPDFARTKSRHVVSTFRKEDVRWNDFEYRLMPIILSFFGALGLLDIAWEEGADALHDRDISVSAFRMTPLGEYLLGLSDAYVSSSTNETKTGGFAVLPDFTTIVPNGPERRRHESHFGNILSKVSSTDEAAIFKIDFESMLRLFRSGGSIADLRSWLSASDKPLPKNVLRALDDWERQAGRIRIREVTVLECDDEALFEEVIRYKGLGALVREKLRPAAVVADEDSRAKIRKIIEKNKRFCQDVF